MFPWWRENILTKVTAWSQCRALTNPGTIQGCEWALPNIYSICHLEERAKSLLLQNHSHRISMTGATVGYLRQVSGRVQYWWCADGRQMPWADLTRRSAAKLFALKGELRDSQQLPVRLRWMERQWRSGEDGGAKCAFVCLFLINICTCTFYYLFLFYYFF